MKTKIAKASKEHEAFRLSVLAAMREHAATMPPDEILAVASYLVGQIVAMQDQRKLTPREAMIIVSQNIEKGNADAIEATLGNPMGAA